MDDMAAMGDALPPSSAPGDTMGDGFGCPPQPTFHPTPSSQPSYPPPAAHHLPQHPGTPQSQDSNASLPTFPVPPAPGKRPDPLDVALNDAEPLPDDYEALVGAAGRYDMAVLDDAKKHARYAISALMFDDVATAIQNLEQSLKVLERYRD